MKYREMPYELFDKYFKYDVNSKSGLVWKINSPPRNNGLCVSAGTVAGSYATSHVKRKKQLGLLDYMVNHILHTELFGC